MSFYFAILMMVGFVQENEPAPQAVVPTNLFGIKQENQIEVFVASDVSEAVETGVTETLALAVKTWGSSGRLEYWVLGTDRDAALELKRSVLSTKSCSGRHDGTGLPARSQ